MLERLPELLQGKRKLVVVHLMGSHGPYFRRYPEKFRPELEWYPYDKSILYTDTLLEKMIGMFRENPRVKAAVYVSDHSEVPGVGHAADLFEPEMTEIPMFLYLSETLRKQRSADAAEKRGTGFHERSGVRADAGPDGNPSPFLHSGAPDRFAGVCAEAGGGAHTVGRVAA